LTENKSSRQFQLLIPPILQPPAYFAAIITPDSYWIVQNAQRGTPIAIYIGDHDQFLDHADPGNA
jgi:hypothetical protein